MKKYFLLFIPILLFTQCKKDKSDFELMYNTTFEISAGLPPFPFQNVDIVIPNFNIEQRLAGEGFMPDDITTLTTRSLRFDIINSTADFSFLEQAVMEIRAEGLPQIEIGYLDFVPNNQGASLDLIPSLPDVQEYVKQSNFTVIFKMAPRFSPAQFSDVRLYLSFDVFVEGD